jgi:hypothetical protein
VLAAKCVLVSVLLLLTGLALATVLSVLDVSVSQTLRAVSFSMLPLAALLAAAALTASMVRNLRTVLLVLIAAVPSIFLLAWFASLLPGSAGTTWGPAGLAGILGLAGLAGLRLLFSSRRVNAPIRASIFGMTMLLVAVQFTTLNLHALPVRSGSANVSVQAELLPEAMGRLRGDSTLFLSLRLNGLAPSHRVQWKPADVHLSVEGKVARKLSVASSSNVLNSPELPLPQTLTWLGDSPQRLVSTADADSMRVFSASSPVVLRRTETGVAALINDELINNVSSVSVRGRMELREPRVLGRLSLTQNTRLVQSGRTITVLGASLRAHPELKLEFESVLGEGLQDLDNYMFVLVNKERNEAVRMHWFEREYLSGSWLLAPNASGHTSGLLKPGYFGYTPFGWQQLGQTIVQYDGDWMQNAELVVVEWKFVESIPVEARAAVK